MRRSVASVFALGLVALLAACSPRQGAPAGGSTGTSPSGSDAQLAWARAALERNPQLQVLAVDERARIFTVRQRDGGAVRTVRLEELVAGPPPAAASTILREPAADGATARAADAPAATSASGSAAEPAGSPAAGAGDGGSAPGGDTARPFAGAQDAAAPSGVVVERQGGKVRISGPGVSITSAEPVAPAAPGSRTAAPTPAGRASPAPLAPPGVRRVEPVICQGSRELRLDGAWLDTRGNAVEVELGCRLFLTNSRVVAGETGIVVRRGGEVHLANTTVEGRSGAVSLAAGADLYTATSTFHGGLRREPGAEVHDLGSNAWR